MDALQYFNTYQIQIVTESISLAEELVSNHYKISASQWLRFKYDIKTLAYLSKNEIVFGPFAQVVRYEGKPKDSLLGSATYDYYKICLQDHAILSVVNDSSSIELYPFCLYIVTHELVHIVRFCKFLQNFNATEEEKLSEESRVHKKTKEILQPVPVKGLDAVLAFYDQQWMFLEGFQNLSQNKSASLDNHKS